MKRIFKKFNELVPTIVFVLFCVVVVQWSMMYDTSKVLEEHTIKFSDYMAPEERKRLIGVLDRDNAQITNNSDSIKTLLKRQSALYDSIRSLRQENDNLQNAINNNYYIDVKRAERLSEEIEKRKDTGN